MSDLFVHEKALCESDAVGRGTRVWAFAHILAGARVGQDCNICDGVFVEGGAMIGDRVTVKCGVQLWDGITIEDDVFIGPNATFTNDPFPRSKVYPEKFSRTVVRRGASIGANATLLPGIEIGARAMVGAGSVVTRSVPPNAIAAGNPARIIGYVDAPKAEVQVQSELAPSPKAGNAVKSAGVGGVQIFEFPWIKDMRGDLSVGEFGSLIPFVPKRYFLVFNVPSREVRGEHAHKQCHQFIISVKGSCSVLVDNGFSRKEIILDNPASGVYLPPLIWGTQYKYSSDAVLLVFASELYDPSDYIRTYDEFQRLVNHSDV